jgi:hypothetical protein
MMTMKLSESRADCIGQTIKRMSYAMLLAQRQESISRRLFNVSYEDLPIKEPIWVKRQAGQGHARPFRKGKYRG